MAGGGSMPAGGPDAGMRREIDALLAEAAARDIRLWLEDDQLRFSAAKGALTDSLRQRLSARKSDLIAHLRAGSHDEPSLAPLEADAERPLSFAQQRLWVLEQMGDMGAAYSLSLALELSGPLDVAALQAALTEVARRHETLRTVFRAVDDHPVAVVLPAAPFPLPGEDLEEIAADRRMSEAMDRVRAEMARPFDLTDDALLRARLIRLADDHYVLTLVAHHSVADGWSLSNLGSEIGIAYRHAREGAATPAPLPELAIQYSDYAAWQRKCLSGPGLERRLARWHKALDGAPHVLDLPTDRTRPTVFSYRGDRRLFTVPAATLRRVETLSRAHGVTPFLVLFTAFATLLHRIGAPEDMVVGTPVAGRTQPDLEPLIGLFVNTLPLRVDLSGDPNFAQLLERVRGIGLDAFDLQDTPFEKLVDSLGLERSLSHAPLVQSMFTFLNVPPGKLDLDDVEVRVLDLEPGTSQFDLSMTLEADGEGGLSGFIDYATDLFEADTVARWATYYGRLLDGIVEAPEAPISGLRLLSDDERRDLIETWSGRDATVPDRLVHEAFAEMARARPDKPALTMGDETLTYAQLDARAERLARRIAAHLDGDEPIVGICLERSIKQIVAVLATFKAGAACLPLDPHYPGARLAYMIEDCDAPVVVTAGPLLDSLPVEGRVILDAKDEADDTLAGSLRPAREPDALAYLIYTSGTTGNPKGVAVEHGPLAAHIPAIAERYAMKADDRFLQAASLNFDLSWEQIFVVFGAGAELVLLPPGTTDPHDILSLARRHALNVLNLPPALWLPMVRAAKADPALVAGLPLRLMIVGSEEMPVEGVPLWRELGLDVPLMNSYGPTEAVITSAMFDLPDDGPVGVRVPIGHPVAGHRCYILDRHLEPVPVGVPGELYVGGIGLARGYLNQPGLTAERFVPNPFAADGGRMYRTGDLTRWRPDGAIDFLGRIDRQIKLRGFRIEPGEIESALLAHDAVQTATVIVRTRGGRPHLVAYCVCPDGMPPSRDLRRHLGERLPDYMVPSAFVALDRLPLMPNGKIDRDALPAPDTDRDHEHIPPRTSRERTLTAIWEEILGRDGIGVFDNFFELGGDSILSTLVAARARRAGFDLGPRDVFRHQTVAELATSAGEMSASKVPAPTAEAEEGPAPLTPVQTWFLSTATEDRHFFTLDATMTLPAGTPTAAVSTALGALTARHGALRAAFRQSATGWTQEIMPIRESLPLREVDASGVGQEERAVLWRDAATTAQQAIRLEDGQPWTAVLFRNGSAEKDRLFLAVHHLVVDAVSLRVLVEDLAAALAAAKSGEAIVLPPSTAPWRTWCRRIDALPAPLAELEHWTREVSADPLPRDRLDSTGTGTEGETDVVSVTLDPETTDALLRGANGPYRTRTNELLMAGLLRAIGAWTGSSDLTVAVEGHGRQDVADDLDISRTVGWFTVVHPVRLRAPAGASIDAVVRAVKEQVRGAPRNGQGYGLLRWLSGDAQARDVLAASNPEIVLNYLGQVDAGLYLPGGIAITADIAPTRGARLNRPFLIEIDALVSDGRLSMRWAYWPGAHDRATIERLAAACNKALREIVHHCLSPEAGGYTPSDFPLAGLDQATLDRLAEAGSTIEDIIPLSPLQQGMLFEEQFGSGSRMWFEQMVVDLSGPMVPETAEAAWQDLSRRHPALRSAILWEGLPQPLQVVWSDADAEWHYEDLSALTADERDARIAAFLEADRRRGFDLSSAPLSRATLFRLDAESHRVVWSAHHAVVDGWCQSIMVRDLSELYRARAVNEAHTLPPAGRYRDFVAWLTERDGVDDERFWREDLAGIDEPAEFELGYPGPAPDDGVRDYRDVRRALDRDLSEHIRAFARQRRLTPNTIVQGAWAVVLSRYLGGRDVLFGAVVSGRPPDLFGVNDTVGLFVNTLPVRLELPADRPIAEWLADVQARQVEREAHGFVSLVDIQGWSSVPRGTPLFETLFAFENLPVDKSADTKLPFRVTDTTVTVEEVNYPLLVQVLPDDSFQIKVSFDASRYPARAAEAIIGHLAAVLRGMVEQPDAPLSSLVLLADAERRQVVETWNATGRNYAFDLPVGRRISQAAARWPERIAVACDEKTLTYRELEARANRLAHRLQRLGIGRDVAVGVMVERGINLPVALAGVLKSGGCYVPVDPLYPPERIAMMLEDAEARLIITEAAVAPLLPPTDLPLIHLDTDADDLATESADPPAGTPEPGDLAYVMFTSGSTGRPKGVMIEQRSVAGFCDMMTEVVGMGTDTRVLAVTTVSFDVSLGELVHPLTTGARVEIATRDEVHDPALLIRRIAESDANFMQATPATWRMLIAAGWNGKPDMTLISGGEPLPRDLGEALKERAAVAWNGYGPTEATVWGIHQRLAGNHRDHLAPNAGEATGNPMPNYRTYIVDDMLNPLPVGVAGELYLGGPPLARGYIGRPDLTAERFFPDPFLGGDERIYRTGDLARWLPDGRIEYLGRVDTQVKIRGFRIELGEIESVLRDHPAVRDAAVKLFGSGDEARLVAYVSPDSSGLDVLAEPGHDDAGERVDQWRAAWETAYGGEAADDLAFDIRSWRDSRTGEAIPEDEMHEWVDATVGRILALKPQRILEIGCGTGLLLSRVAPHCERYVATDLSATVAEQVQVLAASTPALSAVEVLCRPADDFSGLGAGSFDLVIVNSVVQYFPDAGYLVGVLAGAADLVADGGALFIGDVRHAGLLEQLHLFALLPSAPARMPLAEFTADWRRRVLNEEELLIEPAFFVAMGSAVPRLTAVEAQVKAGRADNEMTRFRYDAVLRIADAGVADPLPAAAEWSGNGITADGLRNLLERKKPSAVIVRSVGNGRVARLSAGVALLREVEGGTVEDLRHRFAELPDEAHQPQDLADVAAALGYDVAIGWAGDGSVGDLDMALRRDGPAIQLLRATPDPTADPSRLVGSPLRRAHLARLPEVLRLRVQEVLPDYMVPAVIRVMDPLPLTPSGKVDRRRLPEPDAESNREGQPVVRPRTPIEAILCDLFAEVLGVRRIGVDDDFFRLGGHSLLATQLVSRASAATGCEVPVRWLFEAPTPAALAARIEGATTSDLPPIVPRAKADTAPPSFAQRRLWFLDRLEPGGHAYNMPGAFRVSGDLKVDALEAAFAEVVRRHATLRTCFVERDGDVVQEILAPEALPIPVDDLADLAPAAREAEVRTRMQAEATTPFDLARGPLIRLRLLRLAPRDHVLLATMHHIVSDGWSIGVLGREIAALYAANAAPGSTEAVALPILPVSYADFAVWQNDVMAGERLAAEIDHWRTRLEDAPAALTLPTDRPRREGVAFTAGSVPVRLPAALVAELTKLTRSAGGTLFMTLLAGYAALLGRWAGQDDVVVGTPVANRTRVETEGLIGFFVNTLALRSGPMTGLDVLGLIRRVRDVALDAFSHQDVPFERLVEALQPERSASHSPLFQTMFVFQNIPEAPVVLPGLTLEPLTAPSIGAKFDLTLVLESDDDTIGGALEFNADLFSRETIEAFVEQWLVLLQGMAAAPTGDVERIPLMSGRERQRLLVDWSDGGPALRTDGTVLDLLAERAAADAETVALDDGNGRITFAELAERVEGGACALRDRGVQPGDRVAVSLDRGPAQVVAFLAALRAGAAAVPLDVTHPEERRQAIIADAAATVVVDSPLSGAKGKAPPMPEPDGEAYVIYTSGSTGRPKGVAVGHAGLANLGLAQAARYGLAPGSRLLQIVSPAFDVAVGQIATMLASGATLCFAPADDSRPGPALAEVLIERRITHLEITPSMLAAVPEERPLPDLACIVIGGEPCPPALAARWAQGRRLINAYGPTEATVSATAADVETTDGRLPIGRPLPGVRTYVVDAGGALVPPGIVGELWIGGAGVAHGYLGDDTLTETHFAPDPFAANGGRVYRTGDRARWRHDGQIEFLGRVDGQVKLRGVRVELAEVEAALKEQPGVDDAIADIRGGNAAGRLVAWVVPTAAGTPSVSRLRDALRARLPDAMVPAAIGIVDAVPRTASGKADRRALVEPRPGGGTATCTPPRDPQETAIAGMWTELLELDGDIDVHTSFFDLGGHSLLAARLASRLRDAFGVDVPLRSLFTEPTIAALARQIGEATDASTATDGPIRPTARRRRTSLERRTST